MEKIKVGYYVRFRTLSNEVKIRKIIKIDNNIYELDKNEVTTDKYIIGEPSENIIDLIEVGDYVNGDLVTFISSNPLKNQKGKPRIILNDSYSLFGKYEGIKTIVTKEQFESIKYEVE